MAGNSGYEYRTIGRCKVSWNVTIWAKQLFPKHPEHVCVFDSDIYFASTNDVRPTKVFVLGCKCGNARVALGFIKKDKSAVDITSSTL